MGSMLPKLGKSRSANACLGLGRGRGRQGVCPTINNLLQMSRPNPAWEEHTQGWEGGVHKVAWAHRGWEGMSCWGGGLPVPWAGGWGKKAHMLFKAAHAGPSSWGLWWGWGQHGMGRGKVSQAGKVRKVCLSSIGIWNR